MSTLYIIVGLFIAALALIAWSLMRIAAWADRADQTNDQDETP